MTSRKLATLARLAKAIGLEVLMEIHSEEQLDKYTTDVDIIGVNNRNLENFIVDINTSVKLFNSIPSAATKISESGISNAEAVVQLKQAGYQGFLIGEHFMKTPNPAQACAEFINEIKKLEQAHESESLRYEKS